MWQAFRSFIWDSDSHLKSAAERRMLFKLDLAMLPCLCLGECRGDESPLTARFLLQVPGPEQYLQVGLGATLRL